MKLSRINVSPWSVQGAIPRLDRMHPADITAYSRKRVRAVEIGIHFYVYYGLPGASLLLHLTSPGPLSSTHACINSGFSIQAEEIIGLYPAVALLKTVLFSGVLELLVPVAGL